MSPHFIISLVLLVLTAAQEKLTSLLFQPPPDLKLEKIADVIEGHEDLYLASEFSYRTAFGLEWVGVLSSNGSTNLEGAYFEWSGAAIASGFEDHNALAYVASYNGEYTGMLEVKVTLANGEEVTLKSWLPSKTGCWTNTPWYQASTEVDEFGEEWPYMELIWRAEQGAITYITEKSDGKQDCGTVHIYSGTNPCDSLRGLGTDPGPSQYCGEIPSKYKTNNVTIVQDGDGIIQYYAQGRSRRFTPKPVQPPGREPRGNLH